MHADIRPGWKTTHNVLCSEDGSLVLIDYEGLILDDRIRHMGEDGSAVTLASSYTGNISTFLYVWWQVLYMAYVWMSRPDDDAALNFTLFLNKVTDGSWDEHLKKLLGGRPTDPRRARELISGNMSEENVSNLLQALSSEQFPLF